MDDIPKTPNADRKNVHFEAPYTDSSFVFNSSSIDPDSFFVLKPKSVPNSPYIMTPSVEPIMLRAHTSKPERRPLPMMNSKIAPGSTPVGVHSSLKMNRKLGLKFLTPKQETKPSTPLNPSAEVFTFNNNPRIVYSKKVFIGAVPPGTSEHLLLEVFEPHGDVVITWPEKGKSSYPKHGYAFAIYADQSSVNKLLESCEILDSKKYMIGLPGYNREIQIRPFALDSHQVIYDPLWFRFVRLSVFIGGLPRQCTASELAKAVSEKFGAVLHASIELDIYYSYPKGAARVIFRNINDYCKAARSGHTKLVLDGTEHQVELKPFLYNGINCEGCAGPPIITDYFCVNCLKYLCKTCWNEVHFVENHWPGHRMLKDTRRELPSSCRTALCHSAAV